MRVQNKSKRLICLQTAEGRVDLLPNEITEDDRIDAIKNEKVFKALVEAGDIAEVKSKAKKEPKKKTQKELLIEEAEALDIDTTDMTIDELKEAIAESLAEAESAAKVKAEVKAAAKAKAADKA